MVASLVAIKPNSRAHQNYNVLFKGVIENTILFNIGGRGVKKTRKKFRRLL
jgi:hypothetical protein